MTGDVTAIVVHHKRYPDVLRCLSSAAAAGIRPEMLWVIDTSDDEHVLRQLKSSSGGWHVQAMPNRGFGAAVNLGCRLAEPSEFTLVLTHEVMLQPDLVAGLVRALEDDPSAAAAGPDTLLADERVWSRGGYLTRRLHLPKHDIDNSKPSNVIRQVEWLDGAITLYRTQCLTSYQFREDFFLYVEEVELHARLRADSWRIITAPGTTVSQSTSGMPPYWEVRNTLLFQAAHGTRLSKILAPPYVLARTLLVLTARGRPQEWWQAFRGLGAGARLLVTGRKPMIPNRF